MCMISIYIVNYSTLTDGTSTFRGIGLLIGSSGWFTAAPAPLRSTLFNLSRPNFRMFLAALASLSSLCPQFKQRNSLSLILVFLEPHSEHLLVDIHSLIRESYEHKHWRFIEIFCNFYGELSSEVSGKISPLPRQTLQHLVLLQPL